jgi:hypothetical protein
MALGTPLGPVSDGRVHADRYHRAGAVSPAASRRRIMFSALNVITGKPSASSTSIRERSRPWSGLDREERWYEQTACTHSNHPRHTRPCRARYSATMGRSAARADTAIDVPLPCQNQSTQTGNQEYSGDVFTTSKLPMCSSRARGRQPDKDEVGGQCPTSPTQVTASRPSRQRLQVLAAAAPSVD